MWTTNFLALIINYLRSYLECFKWKCADTRVEYGRFYLLNWAFTSYALFVLYYYTGFLEKHDVSYGCLPEKHLPFPAVFLISEIASFILLACSYIDVALNRANRITWRRITSDFRTIGPRPNWRLYRLMWVWFPYTILIVSLISSGHTQETTAACVYSRAPAEHYRLHLLWSLIWPGLTVASLLIIGANWLAFRWKLTSKLLVEFLLVGISYVLVFAIIGPPDIAHLLDFCRQVPSLFELLSTRFLDWVS
jgi:hypothetical protein